MQWFTTLLLSTWAYTFSNKIVQISSRKCRVEGRAGTAEKSWSGENVNSQSNWLILVGPCPIPHWPFRKWTMGWVILQSHLVTSSFLPPLPWGCWEVVMEVIFIWLIHNSILCFIYFIAFQSISCLTLSFSFSYFFISSPSSFSSSSFFPSSLFMTLGKIQYIAL